MEAREASLKMLIFQRDLVEVLLCWPSEPLTTRADPSARCRRRYCAGPQPPYTHALKHGWVVLGRDV
jgi:hypothetical protein